MNRKDRAIIQQMQETIKLIVKEHNTASGVSQTALSFTETENIPETQKLKAAYALNLCTVSVSQIIDYNDIYVLEQEYEAILNNLNIEEMPKDNALLNILKQILDTVTFFRIQEEEKKLIELKYQQQVKEAVWSAVPNIGLLLAGGNPVTLAISLATQVGMGYMNYRKEKAKIGLEKQTEMWQLQRSAIEQFNGLRRELFDTTWRLAERYSFPDNYRLTERQINQYNAILMDPDNSRRYERLLSIEDKFQAYLPFWYYLGNAARLISIDNKSNDSIHNEYNKLAKTYYKHYLDLDENCPLLRENQITCSCALEYIELPGVCNDEKIKYLNRAVKMSGNSPDVLQLCAMEYLSLGKRDDAAKLFRGLINEGYNTIINSQMLSLIYIAKYNAGEDVMNDYSLLSQRVNNAYLAQLPTSNKKFNPQEYISVQCKILKIKNILVLKQIHDIFEKKYNKLIPRVANPSAYFANESKRQKYAEDLRNADIAVSILKLFNDLISTVGMMGVSSNNANERIKDEVSKRKNALNCYYDNKECLKELVCFSFDDFTKEFFIAIVNGFDALENADNFQDITKTESDLKSFCSNHPEIDDPDYLFDHMDDNTGCSTDDGYFTADILAEDSKTANTAVYQKIENIAGEAKQLFENTELRILTRNDGFAFRAYFSENNKKGNTIDFRPSAVFVIDDTGKRNRGLIVTDKAFIPVEKGRVKKALSAEKAKSYFKLTDDINKKMSEIIESIKKDRDDFGVTISEVDYFTEAVDKAKKDNPRIDNAELRCLADNGTPKEN